MKSTSHNQANTTDLLAPLSTAEESSLAGGASLFARESIGAAVPGARSSVSISASSTGTSVQTSYSIGSSVRSGGINARKRSFFFGSLFDFF